MAEMAARSASPPELMAVALARTIRDGEVVAQGVDSVLASLAILAARRLHAPSLTWITVAGGVDPLLSRLPESSVSPAWLEGTHSILGNPEFYRLAMRGGVDRMFLGAAQIDRRGRLNLTLIGNRDHPRVRLPGGGGAAVLAQTVDHVVAWRTRHTPEIFVPEVDFVTAVGNVEAVVTPLGVLRSCDGSLVLRQVFPGVTVDEVAARTGFPVRSEEPVEVLLPSEEELRVVRALDPHGRRELEFRDRGHHASVSRRR
jgi:glutaconate CoA-transferase subunit B